MLNKKITFDIPWSTLLPIIIILVGIYFLSSLLVVLLDFLILLFVSIVLAASITPLIDWFESHKVHRSLSSFGIIFLIFSFFITIVALIIPMLTTEISAIIEKIFLLLVHLQSNPDILSTLPLPFIGDIIPNSTELIQNILPKILEMIPTMQESLALFLEHSKNILNIVWDTSVFFILLYLQLVDRNTIEHFAMIFLPEKWKKRALQIGEKAQTSMGNWLKGQAMMSLFFASSTAIFCLLVGNEHSMIHILIAAMFDVIGMFVAGLISVPLFFLIDPMMGIYAACYYLLASIFEAYFLTPYILGSTTGLSMITIILAVLIGSTLLGTLGAIIAIPVAAGLQVVWNETSKT